MAKDQPAAEAAAATTESAADKRAIVLGNGERRLDYIRRRWKEGTSGSDITKELNDPELKLNPNPSKKIPYQIVFQATKGQPGGPAPKAETAAQPAAEATATS